MYWQPSVVAMVVRCAFVLLAVRISATLPAAAQSLTYDLEWGELGTANGQLNTPSGIDIGPSGDIFVCESGNSRVSRFTATGQFIAKFGDWGTGPGQFMRPNHIAFGPSGHLYVTDMENHRIQKFTEGGTYVTQWGNFGTGPGEFAYPWGIAVDADDFVFVVSRDQTRVQKFTSSGIFVTEWGSEGTGPGQFQKPHALVVDPSGNLYVGDVGRNDVQKFAADSSFILQWGEWGSLPGQFLHPHSIKWTSMYGIVTIDWLEHPHSGRLQSFTEFGVLNGVLIDSSLGTGPGEFDTAYSLVTDDFYTYVVEWNNHRVQRFRPTDVGVAEGVEPSSWAKVKNWHRR